MVKQNNFYLIMQMKILRTF